MVVESGLRMRSPLRSMPTTNPFTFFADAGVADRLAAKGGMLVDDQFIEGNILAGDLFFFGYDLGFHDLAEFFQLHIGTDH